ncbi:MAG: RNB domain-containing ribonuclease [Actinomycetia bacterium]|nr:RNB domain-containing ribonuclease [Actinomycetes bacterium]
MIEAGLDDLRQELEISRRFPSEVEASSQLATTSPPSTTPRGGTLPVDLTAIPFVTIDPPASMDLDQAVHIEKSGSGFQVDYAIADPTTFVAPGSAIDAEAHRRGLTMYAPDGRTPLYPTAIGEAAASLLPDVDRPSVVWRLRLDAEARLIETDVVRAIVRSREKLAYSQAQRRIIEGVGSPTLMFLRDVGVARQALEVERGGVSLKLPSQEVELIDDRYHLVYDETLAVEEWNAQISLMTGMAAAQLMLDARVGLLRTLPTPDDQILAQIRLAAITLGVEWPDHVGYADRVRQLSPDDPRHLALLNHAVRALRGADYLAFDGETPVEGRHWAIAAHYAHVTAPLRRLCDRYTNEVSLAIAAGQRPPEWALERLVGLPETMRAARRKESQLDRASINFVEAVLLAPRVGDEFEATVTSRRGDDRSTIQIADPAIAAMIAAGLEPGDTVRVRLTEAVPATRRIRFDVVT